MSRQRERATGNHTAERGDMLRILVVETDVFTTKKAPSGRSVHDVTLDCARIDRHPDETPMDVLLERIAFAFDQRHMNPAKQIMRPWRHKRGAGAGGAITARRLDSAEESAIMAPGCDRDGAIMTGAIMTGIRRSCSGRITQTLSCLPTATSPRERRSLRRRSTAAPLKSDRPGARG